MIILSVLCCASSATTGCSVEWENPMLDRKGGTEPSTSRSHGFTQPLSHFYLLPPSLCARSSFFSLLFLFCRIKCDQELNFATGWQLLPSPITTFPCFHFLNQMKSDSQSFIKICKGGSSFVLNECVFADRGKLRCDVAEVRGSVCRGTNCTSSLQSLLNSTTEVDCLLDSTDTSYL